MDKELCIKIAEAIIFSSEKPVSIKQLLHRLPANADMSYIVEFLLNKYKDGGFRIEKIGDTLAFRTSSEMASHLIVEKTIYKKLSKAALEILSIIAYHQPITRAEIEDIRGVSVSQGSLDVLFESNWVEPRGYKDVPGKPSTWRTTRNFLDHFGLESIKHLPGVSELKASGLLSRNIGPSVLNRDNISEI